MNSKIVLFDTEYTAWEGSKARNWSEPWEHREIIQIAAVKIIIAEKKITELGYFDCLVRPNFNAILSPYLVNLTGIHQVSIDTQGINFKDAFSAFFIFCDSGRIPLFCYGDDSSVLDENFVLNKMKPIGFPAGIRDIREMFEKLGIDTSKYSSGTIHQAVGAMFDCAAHNALNDVRSLVVTLRHLMQMDQIQKEWLATYLSS